MVTIETMSSSKQPSKGFSRKLLILAIVLTAAATLLLLLLPYGIRYGAIRTLSSAGAKEVTLDDVDFNPFTGRLLLHGLTIKKEGKRPLFLPKGDLTFDWRPLFHKEIRCRELTLKDSELLLEEKEDGRIVVGGIPASPEKTVEEKTEGAPWTFTLNRLHLSGIRLHLQTPQAKAVLLIDEGDLTELSSGDPAKVAHLKLKGHLNDSPMKLSAILSPFSTRPNYAGKVALKKFNLTALAPFLPDEWETEGQLTFDLDFKAEPSASPPFTIQGKAAAEGLRVVDHRREISLLAARNLLLEGIEIAGRENTAIDEIQGEGVEIGSKEGSRPLTRVEKITVRSAHYAVPRIFRMSSAELQGLDTVLHRNIKGKFREIEETFPTAEARPLDEEATENIIGIDKIEITKSSITFHDDAVSPPYHVVLHIEEFDLSNMESEKNDQPSPLSLQGKVGKYTTLQLRGNLYPFVGKTTLDLEGKVKGLDLPPLSSYTGENLGYNLVSGQLDGDFKIETARGKINGEGKLTLNNLEVSPKNEKKMEKLAAQLTMPLDAALAMLRDKEKNIRLTLPVSGAMDDPKFDLSDVINQALGKALKTSAVSFLKYTLQPYGAILTVAQLAGKTVTAVRLDPVSFPPGSAELDPGANPYLDRVATLMEERPEIRLKLCGKATPTDRTTEDGSTTKEPPVDNNDSDLLTLARNRASAIKDFLVTRKGIAPERLFICKPEVDNTTDAAHQVEILI